MSENQNPNSGIKTRHLTLAQKAKQEVRLNRLETMMLQGVTSHSEIAAAFGVSRHTVIRWIKLVTERMKRERPDEIETARNLRRGQLENIFRKAMVSFERSREENSEETVEKVRCRMCGGEGTLEEKPNQWEDCTMCHGKGMVVEKVVKKIKTSPGDATFLRVAKETVCEIAKIDGVVGPETTKMISTRLLQTASGASEDLKTEIHQLYFEAPEDTIIKAMLALEELDLTKQRRVKKSNSIGSKVEVLDEKNDEERTEQNEAASDEGS